MTEDFPSEIAISELAEGGVRYRLPTRRAGCATAVGIILIVFGLALTLAASAFGLAGLTVVRSLLHVLFVLLLSAPFLAIGVFLFLGGAWTAFGHTEVRLEAGKLASLLKIGPLRYFVRRREIAEIRRIAILSDGEQKVPWLVATCANSRPIDLAALYPYDWLWYLGTDLARRIREPRGNFKETLELEEEWTDFTGDRPAQPILSRIAVSDDGVDRLRIQIPADGWRSLNVLLISVFALVFSSVGLAFLFTPRLDGNSPVFIALILFALAAFQLVFATAVARRSLEFEVIGETLTLRRLGLTSRSRTWERNDIDAIRAVREQRKHATRGVDGPTTTWVWITELQIHLANARPVILTGRYGMHPRSFEQEWEWLATKLRESLDVPA